MLTKKDKEEIEKIRYISTMNSGIERLEFQRNRILSLDYNNLKINPNHDADFYMILLRRLYRVIEKLSKTDSRIANLKGVYKNSVKKIKIRDHFEHEINYDEFSEIIPSIKISCGLVLNDTNPHIISGEYKWFLNEDHETFLELIKKFTNLYPFKE